jgi:GT2 family glycosyltransferase
MSALGVVIPSYNRRDLTLSCIRRLNEGPVRARIYLSDSASTDGTPEAVSKEPNVQVLNVGSAAWWSEAVNSGIKAAVNDGCDLVLILNDDIDFEIDLIPKLIDKHLGYPSHIISPLQESPTGHFLGMRYRGFLKQMVLIETSEIDAIMDSTNGCCLLVPTSVFDIVGLINERNCPHQYGDTEFQLRAARAGVRTLACPSIKIKQLPGTDYFSRLSLSTLFTFKGSPLHLGAYLKFGETLFNGQSKFILLGGLYHLAFIKTLLKALLFLSRAAVVSALCSSSKN